jgi:hypothetical protein
VGGNALGNSRDQRNYQQGYGQPGYYNNQGRGGPPQQGYYDRNGNYHNY